MAQLRIEIFICPLLEIIEIGMKKLSFFCVCGDNLVKKKPATTKLKNNPDI